MPVRYPDEFRQRAIELARTGDQPVAKVAADLGIAPSCLRRWMKQDDIDGGRREASTPTSGPSWCVFVVSCAPPRWR